MFGMGMGELLVILVIALLFLGPARLPEAAKALGKGLREIRRQRRDLEETLEQDETLGSTVRELKSVLRGDLADPERTSRRRSAPQAISPTTATGAGAAPAPTAAPRDGDPAAGKVEPTPAVSTSAGGASTSHE